MRLIFFFLSLIPLISSGQELPIFIEEPINESFLEHLIKEGIDSVRLSHSLSDLANDSILYNAARHHAIYLKKEDKLSHTEKGIMGFETPQQRAYSFGASNLYLVGENIALNQFLSPLRTGKGKISTYTQLANSIVNQWVNSPGHFKNIVTPKYNKTGLAVAINLADNSVFIVQKFAHVIFQYEFNENKKIFKYSTFQQRTVSQQFDTLSMNPHEGIHAWKVKSPENLKKYYEGNRIINSDPRLLEIIPNGRSIQVLTKGVEHLEKFIQNRKDGLAIELMSYEEYHCGNPEYYIAQSRRNLQCEFSGKLLRPVYKKKLNPKILYSYSSKFKSLNNTNPFLKAAFQSFQPKLKKHFNYKLAKIPKNQSGYIEFNLVYLKNNEVVRIRHLSGVCGEKIYFNPFPDYQYRIEKDTLALDLPSIDSTFYFYFSKGKSDYNIEDITPLLFNGFEKYLIYSVNINAFSSIEGLSNINKKLQEDRAQSIVKAIQSRQELNIIPKIQTQTNWELFSKQLKEESSLSFLTHYTNTKQKKFVDSLLQLDTNHIELQLMLDSQRYASIRVYAIYNYKDFQFELFTKYFSLFLEEHYGNIKNHLSSKYLDSKLQQLLYSTFQSIKRGSIPTSNFVSFKPPMHQHFQNSIYQYYLLSDQLGLPPDANRWTNFYNLINSEKQYIRSEIINNMLTEQFENYRKDSTFLFRRAKILEKHIQNLSNKQDYNTIADSFLVTLYIDILNHIESIHDDYLIERASSYVFNKYRAIPTSNLDNLLKVAKLYVFIKDYDKAYQLLEPHINLTEPNLGIISLYSKLIYQNSNEFPETLYGEWLKKIEPLFPIKEWCQLFVGPCNISFQVFDDQLVRELYCNKCSEFGNYATKSLVVGDAK